MEHDFRRPRTDGGARAGAPGPAVGKSTLTAQLPGEIHALAATGTAGAGGPLPHLDRIQRAFGHHDLGGVQAHIGGGAADAAGAMGAQAFASGDHVAFAAPPDVALAAHEAAHVVQQRGGVRLAGGVGQHGDAYEAHADQVADHVVRGTSAEPLLDTMAHRGASGGPAVQHRQKTPEEIAVDAANLAAQTEVSQRRYHAILALAGTSARAWEAQITGAAFLGHAVRGHADLLGALRRAQDALAAEFPGLDPAQVGQRLGIRGLESKRAVAPAAGRDVISAHSFGLAIDINKMIENRFIAMNVNARDADDRDASDTEVAVIDAAMWFMHREHYNILAVDDANPPITELHRGYARASDAMVRYFALADDRTALIGQMVLVGELAPLHIDDAVVDARRAQIAAHRAAMSSSNPVATERPRRNGPRVPRADGHGDITTGGFYDLDEKLVVALTNAGLRWGGTLENGKDLMHFDWNTGIITEARRSAGSNSIAPAAVITAANLPATATAE